MHKWLQFDALLHVERSNTLGSVELVGRNAEQVHAEILDIERDLACGLYGVGVEEGTGTVGDLA